MGLVDNEGRAPVWVAAQGGWRKVVMYLIKHGADKDAVVPGGDGSKAIHFMAQKGYVKEVVSLLEKSVDIEAKGKVRVRCSGVGERCQVLMDE